MGRESAQGAEINFKNPAAPSGVRPCVKSHRALGLGAANANRAPRASVASRLYSNLTAQAGLAGVISTDEALTATQLEAGPWLRIS
jgi:hypothetical protein